MTSRIRLAQLVLLGVIAVGAPRARATFHVMQIEQVIGGVHGDTTAQAIQLRMRLGGQLFVSLSRIRAWDAAGQNPVMIIDLTSDVSNGLLGERVLIASAGFTSLTSPATVPDFTMTNLIPEAYLAAGSLTFEDDFGTIFWRLSWGGNGYTGSNAGSITNDPNGNFGPPVPDALPSSCSLALQFQGSASALSTQNIDDYSLTDAPAVLTNNARLSFTVNSLPGVCCSDGECEDGIGCTINTCNAGTCAEALPDDALCDNGSVCDGEETCDPALGCQAGTPLDCDDLTACTLDSCDPATGCMNAPDDGACGDDGVFCNGATVCRSGDGCVAQGDPCATGELCREDTDTCEPPITISLATVADGLVSPVQVTHAGDGSGRLFILDQAGQIRIVENDVLLVDPFLDISDRMVTLNTGFDERGALGLAFHPDYAANGRFFLRYSAPRAGVDGEPCFGTSRGCHTAVVSEFLVIVGEPNRADPASEVVLFTVDEPEFNHNAGAVAFGPDGFLYLSFGDGGGRDDGLSNASLPHGPIGNGQNIDTPLGAVLRIDVDSAPDPGLAYAIPLDNPFVGGPGLDEVFAYGFRNPFKFSFDDGPGGDGSLYLGDVGQELFEEVNIVVSGGNYGWVIREGAHCFDPNAPTTPPATCDEVGTMLGDPLIDPVSEYIQPILCLTNADCAALGVDCGTGGLCLDEGGISVIAGSVYRGSMFPALVGRFVYGDFSASFGIPTGRIYYFDTTGPDAFVRREFSLGPDGAPLERFVKGMGEDEAGELYVCVSSVLAPTGTTGVVLKISQPLPTVSGVSPRYLRIVVPSNPAPFGLVVTPGCGGTARHVGLPSGPENTALLVDDPADGAFLTSDEWGAVVHVTGADIVPDTLYEVRMNNGTAVAPNLSSGVTARTALWGDVVGAFENGAWTPPNGSIGIASDTVAMLDRFSSSPSAPPLFQTDLVGVGANGIECQPDLGIDILDIVSTVDAFSGIGYSAFTGCAEPCP